MVESPEAMGDIEQIADASDDEKSKRSRWALVAILLLLLLLCTITTTVDVWVNRDPNQVRFIARNLECLQCHTELIPDLRKASVHNPFLLKECTACHTRHGSEVTRTERSGGYRTWERARTVIEWLPFKYIIGIYDSIAGITGGGKGGEVVSETTKKERGAKSELIMPENRLCWVCHGSLGAKRSMSHQHAPFENGYCTNCHDPHASDFRVLLNQDERDLCVTCHPIGRELAREQVHPPAGERFCTNCHDPHASDWSGILVDNQRDLCFVCHPSVAPLSLKSVQHNPFLYDNCTGCHEPHGSDFLPLLRKDQPPLCYDCHPEIKRDFEKPSHHPVGTIQLNCDDCHNPHAADYDALLAARDNEMCYQCHRTTIGVTYERSSHVDQRCVACHTPHGSTYAPILRLPNPEVCLQCHEKRRYDGKNTHPVRPVEYDTLAQKRLTCTSSCHNPHGTANNHMMRYPYNNSGWGQDGLCLLCHSGVGVKF